MRHCDFRNTRVTFAESVIVQCLGSWPAVSESDSSSAQATLKKIFTVRLMFDDKQMTTHSTHNRLAGESMQCPLLFLFVFTLYTWTRLLVVGRCEVFQVQTFKPLFWSQSCLLSQCSGSYPPTQKYDWGKLGLNSKVTQFQSSSMKGPLTQRYFWCRPSFFLWTARWYYSHQLWMGTHPKSRFTCNI